MNCFFCKGNMEEDHTTHVSDLGHCVVIIKNVPCLKCEQCGEVSYTGAVIRQMEVIVEATRTVMTEIAVVNYSNDVA